MSIGGESEDLLLFALLLDVLLLSTADGLLELAGADLLLVTFGLSEHTLEGFYSLSHAGVQGGLDRVLVIVHILSETNEEGEGLV